MLWSGRGKVSWVAVTFSNPMGDDKITVLVVNLSPIGKYIAATLLDAWSKLDPLACDVRPRARFECQFCLELVFLTPVYTENHERYGEIIKQHL